MLTAALELCTDLGLPKDLTAGPRYYTGPVLKYFCLNLARSLRGLGLVHNLGINSCTLELGAHPDVGHETTQPAKQPRCYNQVYLSKQPPQSTAQVGAVSCGETQD